MVFSLKEDGKVLRLICFFLRCVLCVVMSAEEKPKKRQRASRKENEGPKYDFRKGYWSAATDILADKDFRITTIWIQRLCQPLCIEHSCTVSACLRQDAGLWVAKSTGRPLVKIIQFLAYSMHRAIVKDVYPITPNFSLGESAVKLEQIHGEDPVLGKNWGMDYLKEKTIRELKQLINMALTLISNKLKSNTTFGIRSLVGILSNQPSDAEFCINNTLTQWNTIISVERWADSPEMNDFYELTKGFRSSASLRVVCLCLEQEDKIYKKQKKN